MDVAGPSTLRATHHRVSSSSLSAAAPLARVFGSSRSLWLRRDILRAVEFRSQSVMLLRFLQHIVVRRRLPFVIVRLAIIFSHRMIDKFVPHQNPAQIGMTAELNSVEIEDLALLKFGAPPNRCQ